MPSLPLPRTSLASLVCPSTPFLAPRLLRTPAHLAFLPARCSTPHALAGLHRSSYATHGHKKARGPKPAPVYKRKYKERKALAADEAAPLLKQMRAACDSISVRTLLDLYPGLVASGALIRNDTRRIAQALHARVRNMHLADVRMEDILIFVQRLGSDIQTGTLPPHPYAHVHLLGIYKECEKYQDGYAFWQWLVDKDETFVSQAVYGAAIELMAYGGILPLPELEHLYVDALKRFPGTFAEYHLSPDAIVPDRSQPIIMTDIPVLLLQGILTARMLAHDWRNAYLALDTALRLFPAQVPTRYFELFMTDRPLPEAYTAFLVACRAGVLFKPSHLTGLIKKLRLGLTDAALRERVMALRAVANAIYAYLEAGGTLEAAHVGAFIRAFEVVFPNGTASEEFKGEDATMRNIIVAAAHEFMSTFIQAGLPPQIQVFTALIHLAGRYQVPSLLQACLQDIQTAQLDIGDLHLRIILESAGRLKDKDLIEKYWTHITSNAEAAGKQLDYSDWITLVRACNRGGHTDYFKEQLWKFEHTLSTALKLRLTYHMETRELVRGSPESNMEFAAFTAEIDALRSQVKNIAAVVMSGQPLDLRKSPFYMSLDPSRKPLASPKDLRTVYDELTTDPHQPAPPSGSITSPSLSPTGIPLDELRFQNWVSVLEMMSQARFHEDKRRQSLLDPNNKEKIPFGGQVPEGLPMGLDSLRTMIKELRSPLRKVLSIPARSDYRSSKPQYSPSDHSTHSNSAQDSGLSSLSYRPNIASPQSPTSRLPAGENLPKPPALHYYVSLESNHNAPVRTLSRRPLGNKKSPNHHALRLQPREQASQETSVTKSSAEGTELTESLPDNNTGTS